MMSSEDKSITQKTLALAVGELAEFDTGQPEFTTLLDNIALCVSGLSAGDKPSSPLLMALYFAFNATTRDFPSVTVDLTNTSAGHVVTLCESTRTTMTLYDEEENLCLTSSRDTSKGRKLENNTLITEESLMYTQSALLDNLIERNNPTLMSFVAQAFDKLYPDAGDYRITYMNRNIITRIKSALPLLDDTHKSRIIKILNGK